MANTVKERIKVANLTKFGFQVGQEYVNYSKQLPESDKANVVPGAEFEAELYVADSGKRYLNKILAAVSSAAVSAPKAQAPVVDTDRAKKFTPKYQKAAVVPDSEKMSKADWSAKDRSQLIGGLSHDAAAITAALVNTTSLDVAGALAAYKELLDGMLQVRAQVK